MATAPRACSNPECSFNEDERCAEGEEPDSCPFREERPLIVASASDEFDAAAADEDGMTAAAEADDIQEDQFEGARLSLSRGDRLDPEACSAIMGAAPARIISFIAPAEAGKTSLIAGIYEMFLEGRQEGALFRGSRTMPAFEYLCHLSRAASGRTEAGMERTRHGEGLGYLHIDLVVNAKRLGMLLGDRPGENFVRAAASLESAQSLFEISSASTLAYLIDGKALADPKRRALPRAQAVSILDAIVGTDLPQNGPALAVVLTKADIVERSDPAGFARFDEIVEHLRDRYAGRFHSVQGYRTAASPTEATEGYPRGSGVSRLFVDLLSDPRAPLVSPVSVPAVRRSFHLLGAMR